MSPVGPQGTRRQPCSHAQGTRAGGLWGEEERAGASGAPEGQGRAALFSRCWYAPAGPAQGAASQYSGYQQGQGQQYGSYRASQTGPSAQQQRPYGYEQGQYGNYQQ